MDTVLSWLAALRDAVSIEILAVGDFRLTLWNLLYIPLLVVALVYVTAKIRGWVANRLLVRSNLDMGTRVATGTIIQYLVITIGLLIIVQTAGIDLTTLNVLAGAIGIGAGFGLQGIVSNFISGLVILFERPIKVGDRIVVEDVEGDVVKISGRSTTVITNDNIAMIIPNSKFITENVVNWSLTDRSVRFKIPVSVAYGSDARLVERVLLEVAAENPDVLDTPAPAVRFMEFGDSGLLFELRAWSTTLMHRKGVLISSLNFAIYGRFAEHGIQIPFPQRDIHVRSGSIEREPDPSEASGQEPHPSS